MKQRLFDERLGAPKIGEKVPDLRWLESFEEAFRHEGRPGGFHPANLAVRHDDIPAGDSANDEHLAVLVGEEA